MITRIATALALTLGVLAAPIASALDLPGRLVGTAWLAQHRTEVNIIDVREDVAAYTKPPVFSTDGGKQSLTALGGHIPGALLLDFAKARTTRTIDGREIKWMLPAQADFEKLMRDIGVRAGRPTVIVSDGASGGDLDMAARVYWSLKVYGDDDLAILDGGTTAWLAAGQPFSTDAAVAGGGDWVAKPERSQYFASSEDVAKAGHRTQLVDARPMSFYVGLERKPIVLASGHIEGAVNFPPEVRAAKADGAQHFLGAQQYAAIFRHLDLNPRKPSITYCNTGHLASGAWFVLSEVMHNPNVRLYDGSMYEWTTEGRPVASLPPASN